MCPPGTQYSGADARSSMTCATASIPDVVPLDKISQAAYLHAASNLHVAILNHSLRVWLYARAISDREHTIWTSSAYHKSLLFTACVLHDVGACALHDGPQRFEIQAADAHQVWVAMALHSTPQIPERIAPLARLVRVAVTVDFKNPIYLPFMTTEAEVADFEGRWPRMEIEKILGDTVAEQGVRQPSKAPANCWPGGLVLSRLENPEWTGVNKAF